MNATKWLHFRTANKKTPNTNNMTLVLNKIRDLRQKTFTKQCFIRKCKKNIPLCLRSNARNGKTDFNFRSSGASTDINNQTEQTDAKTKVCWTCFCVTTHLLWSKVVDNTVAFTTIEEEEVPVWSVSLGESLQGETHSYIIFHVTYNEVISQKVKIF